MVENCIEGFVGGNFDIKAIVPLLENSCYGENIV